MELLFKRIMRAVLLDREFYKEVEADPSLNQEALLIVVAVSVISGIGSFIAGLIAGQPGRPSYLYLLLLRSVSQIIISGPM